jgi:hypothetical protein
MKPFILTISGIAALTVSSCVDTQTTAGSGQNRFGYNGTTTVNAQPTSGVQQGVVGNTVTTPAVVENTPTKPTNTTQGSGIDTIPVDRLPTNNTTNTAANTATSNTPNTSGTPSNDTTTSTSGNTAAVTEDKPKKPEYLYGIPVPGRDGMVYSPYNKDAGYIDVRHMKPGALAEDPYTPGKLFRVP